MSHAMNISMELKRSGFSMSVNLRLPGRGVTAIYGPSGSGKTSLLRFVAGLEPSASGLVEVGGGVWENAVHRTPTHKRPIGYVFQDAALLDHLSVLQNLRYGMKRAKVLDGTGLSRAVDLLGIGGLLNRNPATLSGGERQRVGIARALALNPQLLLMDEPLSALDQKRKSEVLPYLEKLHTELEIPVLYVSHSADEVIKLADYAVLLDKGAVTGEGKINEVISGIEPALPTAEGTGVVLEATVTERDAAWNLSRYDFTGGSLWGRDMGIGLNERVRIRILARDVSISKHSLEDASIQNSLPAAILSVHEGSHPALLYATVTIGCDRIVVQLTRRAWHTLGLEINDPCWVHIKFVSLIGCGF